MNWPKERLSRLILPVQNWNPQDSQEDSFVYIDISSVDAKQKKIVAAKAIPCASGPSRARQLVKEGDILVSTVRPNLNSVASVGIELDGSTASTGFCVLRCEKTALEPRYLFHWVQSKAFIGDMVSKATGASYPAVSDAIVHASEIPLPPLEEQRRIAAILDKCQESIQLARKASSLYASLFISSFNISLQRVQDSEDVSMMPLSSVCKRITKGTTPSSLGLADVRGDIPFVRVQDIDRNVLAAESVALRIPADTHHALSRSMLRTGDILVSIAGTIGRVCEVRGLPLNGANCNQAVAVVRPDLDLIRPLFLRSLLSGALVQRQMRRAGVTGTITNLSLSQLGEITIPVLSLASQDVICGELERLAGLGKRFQESHATTERLATSFHSQLIACY